MERNLRRTTGTACAYPAPASCPIELASHSYRLALMPASSMLFWSYQAKPESMTVGSLAPLIAATAALTVSYFINIYNTILSFFNIIICSLNKL